MSNYTEAIQYRIFWPRPIQSTSTLMFLQLQQISPNQQIICLLNSSQAMKIASFAVSMSGCQVHNVNSCSLSSLNTIHNCNTFTQVDHFDSANNSYWALVHALITHHIMNIDKCAGEPIIALKTKITQNYICNKKSKNCQQ